MSQWYYFADATQQGPVTTAQIGQWAAAGQFSADVQVWTEGMTDWLPAKKVPELAAIFQRRPVPAAQPEDRQGTPGLTKAAETTTPPALPYATPSFVPPTLATPWWLTSSVFFLITLLLSCPVTVVAFSMGDGRKNTLGNVAIVVMSGLMTGFGVGMLCDVIRNLSKKKGARVDPRTGLLISIIVSVIAMALIGVIGSNLPRMRR